MGALVQGEDVQTPARPATPPYTLTENNLDLLERWFLEHFGRTAFAVSRTLLPEVSDPPPPPGLLHAGGSSRITAPLQRYSTTRELRDITNPRVFNLKEKTLFFRVKYLMGKANPITCALSRQTVLRGEPIETGLADDEAICAAVMAATACAQGDENGTVIDLRIVEEQGRQDENYRVLHSRVRAGDWASQKNEEPLPLRPYYWMRRRLSCKRNIVMYVVVGRESSLPTTMYATDEEHLRVVIPAALCGSVHVNHQGRDSMPRSSRQSVYWLSIDAEVEQKLRYCQVCNANAPSSPAEPLLPQPPPLNPFQQAVADLFQLSGEAYITYADRLTGWLEMEHVPKSSTSSRLIYIFRRWFRRFGISEVLSCD